MGTTLPSNGAGIIQAVAVRETEYKSAGQGQMLNKKLAYHDHSTAMHLYIDAITNMPQLMDGLVLRPLALKSSIAGLFVPLPASRSV